MDRYPVVAIIPSLNPDDKLPSVIDGILKENFTDVIVVNDGSRQECLPVFDAIEKLPGCVVLHHEINKGKGAALKNAFRYYLANLAGKRYVGVVTADADGQHLPVDIKKCADELIDKSNGDPVKADRVLVLGTRDFNLPNVPFKSRNGNKITTKCFKFLYGKYINDTQTGLRGMSNQLIEDCSDLAGERFEYEINVLIEAAKNGTEIYEPTIETVYMDNNRETHFNPFKDSYKIYKIMLAPFIKFAASGIVSALVDQLAFALFVNVIFVSLADFSAISVSTVAARIVSSIVNYLINRKFVFKAKQTTTSVVKYYCLCILQMLTSAFLVAGIFALSGWNKSVIKIVVDLILFFISYKIQRMWVFKEKK